MWYYILQDGRTPLHLAFETGHTDIATMLIDRGADVNATQMVSLHESGLESTKII